MTLLLCGITAHQSSTIVPNQLDVNHSITKDFYSCEIDPFAQDRGLHRENSLKPKIINLEIPIFRK